MNVKLRLNKNENDHPKSREEGKDQESMQSSSTHDPTPYGKVTKHKKTQHTLEPRGQPFQAGHHKNSI